MIGFFFILLSIVFTTEAGVIGYPYDNYQYDFDINYDVTIDVDRSSEMIEPETACELKIVKGGYVIDDLAAAYGGDRVYMKCDAKCKGPGATPALAWYKEPSGKPISAFTRRVASYSRTSNRIQVLYIRPFLGRDVGRYTCRGWLGPRLGWIEKTITLSMGCPNPTISCDVYRCLPANYRCDGVEQCQDGFDEYGCGPPTCEYWQFLCDGKCVDKSVRCNGSYECLDGADEADCQDDTSFEESDIDIDYDYDCHDNDTSTITTPSETTTESGMTSTTTEMSIEPSSSAITREHTTSALTPEDTTSMMTSETTSARVTNEPASTETTTEPSSSTMTSESISTAMSSEQTSSVMTSEPTSSVMTSEPTSSVMTSEPTSTEAILTSTHSPECTEDEFQCPEGRCISSSWLCDGVDDCHETEADEANCTTDCYGQLDCGDGKCISLSALCDNIKDCTDGRDEMNCSTKSCSEGKLACANEQQCISRELWCNGVADCDDESDEQGCAMVEIDMEEIDVQETGFGR